jgi:hypothetical protein
MKATTLHWIRDMHRWCFGRAHIDRFVQDHDNAKKREAIQPQALYSASDSTPVRIPGLVQSEIVNELWSDGTITYEARKRYLVELHGLNPGDFETKQPSREMELQAATVEASVASSEASIVASKAKAAADKAAAKAKPAGASSAAKKKKKKKSQNKKK